MAKPPAPTDVARIMYKEMRDGDRKKAGAQSNKSTKGGGARDFRFGPFTEFLPLVEKMFPARVPKPKSQDGASYWYEGTLYWLDPPAGTPRIQTCNFDPPNDSRAGEGRIARVPTFDCFDPARIPPDSPTNKVVLILVQRYDGQVWPHFVEEDSLRVPNAWDSRVSSALLACLRARRPTNHAAVGHIDFEFGKSFSNGK